MNEKTKKQTVLIVDDQPANIRILLEILKTDYEIRVAIDGETALDIVRSDNPPDLVLLDVMMPGIDGYVVCERMKTDPRTSDIPVIFITGKGDEEDMVRGFQCGAVDYVVKPFSHVVVKARVKTHAELKKFRDVLKDQSIRDGLTGIGNRRRFDEFLASTWDFASRKALSISVVMIDIDYFKLYNDNYGHQEGDECLKKVAKTLESSLRRRIDLVARYGGEEFGCIMPGTDPDGAVMMAERFRQNVLALEIPHAYSPAGRFVTISLGVAAMYPSRENTVEELVGKADRALYKAKDSGRNLVEYQE